MSVPEESVREEVSSKSVLQECGGVRSNLQERQVRVSQKKCQAR